MSSDRSCGVSHGVAAPKECLGFPRALFRKSENQISGFRTRYKKSTASLPLQPFSLLYSFVIATTAGTSLYKSKSKDVEETIRPTQGRIYSILPDTLFAIAVVVSCHRSKKSCKAINPYSIRRTGWSFFLLILLPPPKQSSMHLLSSVIRTM